MFMLFYSLVQELHGNLESRLPVPLWLDQVQPYRHSKFLYTDYKKVVILGRDRQGVSRQVRCSHRREFCWRNFMWATYLTHFLCVGTQFSFRCRTNAAVLSTLLTGNQSSIYRLRLSVFCTLSSSPPKNINVHVLNLRLIKSLTQFFVITDG